jgi:hypothetical protein
MAKKITRSGSTGLVTHDPQLKTFFHRLAAEGLVIRKKRGARIKNVKKAVMKHARFAFNLGPLPKKRRHANLGQAPKSAVVEKDPVSRLVGAGIPGPSKGELAWASPADIAELLDKPHMLTAEALADQLHVSRETINQWRKTWKIIGVEGAKRGFRFPSWQISERGRPYEAIEDILKELDGDHWAAWRFLEELVPEIGAIGFQALAAGKEQELLKALLGRSYGSFS